VHAVPEFRLRPIYNVLAGDPVDPGTSKDFRISNARGAIEQGPMMSLIRLAGSTILPTAFYATGLSVYRQPARQPEG
jgi:hypothetical protein